MNEGRGGAGRGGAGTVSLSPYRGVMKNPYATYTTNQPELQGMENRYY